MSGFASISAGSTALTTPEYGQGVGGSGETGVGEQERGFSDVSEVEPEEESAVNRAIKNSIAARRRLYLESSGIPKCYWKGLAGYNPQQHPNCAQLLADAKAWLDLFDPTVAMTGFYFHGNTGSGKTLLAAGIALEVATTKSSKVVWRNTISLFQAIRDAWAARQGTVLVDEMVKADLLVLDELGAEQPEPWILTQLYNVINTRIERDRGSMIVTSNYDPDTLKEKFGAKGSDIGDRIVSRLRGSLCIPNTPFPPKDFR